MYGNIRARGHVGAHLGPVAARGGAGITAAVGDAAQGMPGGSPLASRPAVGAGISAQVANVVLVLALLEVVFLVSMRSAFRNYHGG